MIGLLVWVIVLGLIYYCVSLLPLPEPFPLVVKILFIIILILVILNAVGYLPAYGWPHRLQ